MPVYLSGLLLGFSLIMALGPQNIFLLRQSSMRHHVMLSAVTCFICDILLVTASVVGLHDLLEARPNVRLWMVRFGIVFLFYYGVSALKSAYYTSNFALQAPVLAKSRRQIVFMALGFSLLNPHAIIDSLVLIGGGSSQFPEHPQAFLLGVISSSFIWFSALTLTAYYLSSILTRKSVWRIVEFGSGMLMIFFAIRLAYTVQG